MEEELAISQLSGRRIGSRESGLPYTACSRIPAMAPGPHVCRYCSGDRSEHKNGKN